MRLKIYLSLLLFILGFAFLPAGYTGAALFSFSSGSVDIKEGQSFSLVMTLNPERKNIYTAKIELDYPADLLEIRSFSFGSSWTALSQAGYDLIDNQKGKLIKTAGYPGGLSGSAIFGTVSFRAKKSGTGKISLISDSLVLDANNEDVLRGLPLNISLVVSLTEVSTEVVPEISPEIPPSFEIPVSIPSGYIFETDLKSGDKNLEVAYLQLCLASQGFFSGGIDGQFGPATKQAVTVFQEEYFDEILAPWGFEKGTGMASETTRAKLNELCLLAQADAAEEVEIEETPLFDIEVEPEIEVPLFDIEVRAAPPEPSKSPLVIILIILVLLVIGYVIYRVRKR